MTMDAGQHEHVTASVVNGDLGGDGERSAITKSRDAFFQLCADLRQSIDKLLTEEASSPLMQKVQEQVKVSLEVADETFRRYRPEQISISYNGGKDCLVMLVVILAALARSTPPSKETAASTIANGSDRSASFPEDLQAVYIVHHHPFPEVDEFVATSAKEYHLQVTRYVLPMKKGLECYLADRPQVQAVFVGTRRTDPHGEKLTHFDRTDAGWPDFMRVHPVIDWHYAEIWAFIRYLGIPYCSLYDQGYTSLGGTEDTHPNPHLKKAGDKSEGFRPAYELTEDDEERLGRDR